MVYKITVDRIVPPEEGGKYESEVEIYKQKFEVQAENEAEMLNKIIDAVNK